MGKINLSSWGAALAVALFLVSMGCGPVNQKPGAVTATDDSLGNNAMVKGGSKEKVAFSKQGDYVVFIEHIPSAGQSKPQKGINQFRLRIIRELDLQQDPNMDLAVYYRPTKAVADEQHHLTTGPGSDLEKQEDGSYKANFNFGQHGTWEIHIQMNATTGDEYVYQAKI